MNKQKSQFSDGFNLKICKQLNIFQCSTANTSFQSPVGYKAEMVALRLNSCSAGSELTAVWKSFIRMAKVF